MYMEYEMNIIQIEIYISFREKDKSSRIQTPTELMRVMPW